MLCTSDRGLPSMFDIYRDSRPPVPPGILTLEGAPALHFPLPHRQPPHNLLQHQQFLLQQQQQHRHALYHEQQLQIQRQFYEKHLQTQRLLMKNLATSQNIKRERYIKEKQKRKSSDNSFSIKSILGGSDGITNLSSLEDRSNAGSPPRKNPASERCPRIVRPWTDEQSNSSLQSKSSADSEMGDECREFTRSSKRVCVSSDDSERTQQVSPSNCPLGALLRMASQTNFEASETGLLGYINDGSNGQNESLLQDGFSKSRNGLKKRRKTRTAFTNQQIYQLEKRFVYQKYLTPADRDEIAMSLRLSNAQVITWFQNRRAKLKRDLEELKADVTAAKALGTEPSATVLQRLDELMKANEYGLKKKDSGKCGSSEISGSNNRDKDMENIDCEVFEVDSSEKLNDEKMYCDDDDDNDDDDDDISVSGFSVSSSSNELECNEQL